MGQLAQQASTQSDSVATDLTLRVIIQGLPEDVQRMADAIDSELSSALEWQSFAETNVNNLIEIHGLGDFGPEKCPLPDTTMLDRLTLQHYSAVLPDFRLACSPSVYYCVSDTYIPPKVVEVD